nr:hypothetical protein [uncultured Lichenicoccus sp.]
MTPTQQIVAASTVTEDVTDPRGRVLSLRRATKLEIRRLTRACGAAADSDRWFGEVVLAAQVQSIDGVPVPTPQNADQADLLVARLDTEGINAVADWLQSGGAVPREDPTN